MEVGGRGGVEGEKGRKEWEEIETDPHNWLATV